MKPVVVAKILQEALHGILAKNQILILKWYLPLTESSNGIIKDDQQYYNTTALKQ